MIYRILVGIICFTLSIGSIHATFEASISLPEELETIYDHAVETKLWGFIERNSTVYVLEKFVTAKEIIPSVLQSNDFSWSHTYLLEYVLYYITQQIPTLEQILIREQQQLQEESQNEQNTSSTETETNTWTTQTTTPSAPVSDTITTKLPETIQTNLYNSWTKTITMGEASIPVAKFEIVAQTEDILAKQLVITSNMPSFSDLISYVGIYDASWKRIAVDIPTNNKANFTKNILFEKGQTDMYVVVYPRDIGTSVDTLPADAFTLSLEVKDASWATSNTAISDTTYTNTQDAIILSAVSITDIRLLHTYQWYSVDRNMFNKARTDLSIIQITPNNTNNDDIDGIYLETLTLHVVDGTIAWDIHDTLELRRIDTQSQIITPSSMSGDIVSFTLTDFPEGKNFIDKDQQWTFLLTWKPTLDPTVGESIRIEADSSVTTQGIITYRATPTWSIITTQNHTPAYVWSTSVND